jgi:thiol-disulfide isomerase/thioredoxin
MPTLYEVVNRIILPYKIYITVIIVLLIFILALSFYDWKPLFPMVSYFKDVANSLEYTKDSSITNPLNEADASDMILTLYSAEWCPYCSDASEKYLKFKQVYDGKLFNKHKLIVNNTVCNDNNCSNIDSVPTIKLNYKGTNYEYESNVIDVDGLLNFVEMISVL